MLYFEIFFQQWHFDDEIQPKNILVWLASSIYYIKGCSENLPLSAWYILILNPTVSAHLSKADFTDKVSYWLVVLISFTQVK